MKRLKSISIIIPTLNREKVLKEALISINKIEYPRDRFEVVVVSDGSTDGTKKIIKTIRKDLNYKFKFVAEKRKGISHAKNVAIRQSNGEIIVTTDDDCLFEPDWLKKLIKPLNNPKVGAVGGPDRPIEKQTVVAKSIDYAFSSFIGSGGIRGRFLKIKLGKLYPVGCNTAFSKKVLNEVGLFDETLAPGEDTDLNHRIEKAGFRLAHAPNAFVWHRPRNSIRNFIPYCFKRGAARVEIIHRHYELAEMIYFLPALMVLVGLSLILLSFFSGYFLKIFIILLLIYLVIILSAGVSAFLIYRHICYLFLVPFLIFIQHLLHGSGFLINVTKLRKNRKK